MTDAVLALPAGGATDGLEQLRIGGRDLGDLLDHDSLLSLSATVQAMASGAAVPGNHLMLFTRDGRTLDADVDVLDGHVTVHVHDITRHVDEADRFARLALQLHRRNRDLEVLHDAATRLGATLDVSALIETTARLVADYVGARGVQVTAAGHEHTVGDVSGSDPSPPLAAVTLTTARGDLGTVAWWRATPLTAHERRVLDLLRHRAAVAIDHALLLAPPPGRSERDGHGLMTAAVARRRLAGFARPFALALVAHDGDVEPLAARVRDGRTVDVKAHWGPRRLLVALERSSADQLHGWLRRAGVVPPDGEPARWPLGVAVVDDDIDKAIALADRALSADVTAR